MLMLEFGWWLVAGFRLVFSVLICCCLFVVSLLLFITCVCCCFTVDVVWCFLVPLIVL